MEKLKISSKYLAFFLCLVILVLAGSYVVYITYLLPGDTHRNQSQDLQPPPEILRQISRDCSGYVIREIQTGYLSPSATVVHLTPDTLANFSAIKRDLQNATTLPAGDRYGSNTIDWFNGRRSVGTFDNDTQYYEFRDLSCKHSPDPTCNPLNFTQEFEYMGRYYEVLCYPSFAGAHDSIPAPVSPIKPSAGSTQDPGAVCDPQVAALRVPVPVDTSVPIQDPMPGIRYSLNENQSGRTIVLDKGDVVEINLRWIPSLDLRWIIPVSGCGLELANDGYYDTGTDFWNTSGHYRARYRAVSPGTSVIDGKLVFKPDEPGDLRFNLTVIVK